MKDLAVEHTKRSTMKPSNLFDGGGIDDRAVSPVVGVALLIAIAVILATVIGLVVLGIGPGATSAPQAQLNIEYNTSSTDLTLTHRGGDELPADEILLINESGETPLSSVTSTDALTAGNSVTYNSSVNEVTVVWDDPASDSRTVLEEYEG